MSNFNLATFGTELEALREGKYTQTQMLTLDLSEVCNDVPIEIPGGATMLALLPRMVDNNGVEQTSDSTHRCYLKFNSTRGPALPFSLVANSQDLALFAGAMIRLYLTVTTAAVGAKLYCLLGTGISIDSATGGASGGGYVAPSGGHGGVGA